MCRVPQAGVHARAGTGRGRGHPMVDAADVEGRRAMTWRDVCGPLFGKTIVDRADQRAEDAEMLSSSRADGRRWRRRA